MGDFRTLYKDADGRLRWEVVDTLGCVRVEDVDEALVRRVTEIAEADLPLEQWQAEMRRLDEEQQMLDRRRWEDEREARAARHRQWREEDERTRLAREEALDDLYRERAENSPDGLTAVVEVEK